MTNVNDASALPPSLTQFTPSQGSGSDLGQTDFLELMVAQFSNQDPFKPLENGDFLGQLAEFSTVSGITELNSGFNYLASSLVSDQTLQASGLIGRTVLADTSTGNLTEEGGLAGAVDVPISATSATVEVRDISGAVVDRFDVPVSGQGLARFEWDGIGTDGERVPAGEYTFAATISTPAGEVAINTLLAAEVDSVSLSPDTGELVLNFDELGSLPLWRVREIS